MTQHCMARLCSSALTKKWLHVQQDAEAMNFAWVLKKNADNPRLKTLWRYFWINLFSLDRRLTIAVRLPKLSKYKHASKCTEIPTALIKHDWPFPKSECFCEKHWENCKLKGFCSATENIQIMVSKYCKKKKRKKKKANPGLKSLIPTQSTSLLCRKK